MVPRLTEPDGEDGAASQTKRLSANPAEGGPWSQENLARTIDLAVLHSVLSISPFGPAENATL